MKSYVMCVYFYLKLLKLKIVSEVDRQNQRWTRVGQLALTIDEVSAFTALIGRLDANDLSEEDRA